MNITELKSLGVRLTERLGGRLQYQTIGLFDPPFCPFKVSGYSRGAGIEVFFGTAGGYVIIDKFQFPCGYAVSLFRPEPRLLLIEDATSLVKAPCRVYITKHSSYLDCVQKLFSQNIKWKLALRYFGEMQQAITLTDDKCEFGFSADVLPIIGDAIDALTIQLTAPPFRVQKGLKSRYSDKPYIELDAGRVPSTLHTSFPFAVEWCIGDEREVTKHAKLMGPSAVEEFLASFRSKYVEIQLFCSQREEGRAFIDEVVAFQMAFHAFGCLESKRKSKV